MSFLDIARKRYAVRKFHDKPIEEDKLLMVLEAGRVAPSACNLQPWHFIVVRDKKVKALVSDAYPREWFAKAPAIIVICGDHSQSWTREDGKEYCDVDIAIAVDHMALAATDMELGTCWISAFNAAKCRKALRLPDYIEPIALLPIGYPVGSADPERHVTRRKGLVDIVHWDEYNQQ